MKSNLVESDRKYPDTERGALTFLQDESTLDLTGATVEADPSVEGVWMVHLDPALNPSIGSDNVAVVYLKGYRDEMGRPRPSNDFETAKLLRRR